jgi:hypothetical protein
MKRGASGLLALSLIGAGFAFAGPRDPEIAASAGTCP